MALTSSEIDTSKTSAHNARLGKIGMALEALRNVIKGNPGRCLFFFWFRSHFYGDLKPTEVVSRKPLCYFLFCFH